MRTAFIKQLVEEAAINDKIFLIVGDLGYSVVEMFAEKYPERFFECRHCRTEYDWSGCRIGKRRI